MRFKTKAETLAQLENRLASGLVLPQVIVSWQTWISQKERVLDILLGFEWVSGRVIVRSSAQGEDSQMASQAGKYESVAGLVGMEAIAQGVDRVFASYGDPVSENQVFVQPCLHKVAVSGVLFTRDPNNNAPYFVLNFDDTSGETDSVTSGNTGVTKTYYQARSAEVSVPGWQGRIVALARELESLFSTDKLDIEFAIDGQDQLFLLQVRPLVVRLQPVLSEVDHARELGLIQNKVRRLAQPQPYLVGRRSVFGVMPDWNPAEIIGVRPRPLALTLYKELVTDSVWAYQRHNYGYRDLRSYPLMVNFSGLPYIDVRVSFNSFVPQDVPDALAERLVNYYMDTLIAKPFCHDKVEFEVILTCYTPDTYRKLSELKAAGFSESDCQTLVDSLRRLTHRIIHPEVGLWKDDIAKIETLKHHYTHIKNSTLNDVEKIYWLLEDCKRYGTLPFAGLARAGFIAVQLLRSFVNEGVLTADDYGAFMGSLRSVSYQMSRDFNALSKDAFLAQYGHLRPGTYDILSPRYDEAPDRYFDWTQKATELTPDKQFRLDAATTQRLQILLDTHGIAHDVPSIFDFIRAAIEGREYAKFVFTRSLSDVLQLIGQLGERLGFSPEDLSFVDIQAVRSLYATSFSATDIFGVSIAQGRHRYAIASSLNLPALIVDESDATAFYALEGEPNFITLNSCTGPVRHEQDNRDQLRGSILAIRSADPGYDWIFSHGIAGFVTQYGGANSHMAIRAGELNIPAVIGAGELLYDKWSKAKSLQIDCASRQVQVLQ